jgi:hypothetical protein
VRCLISLITLCVALSTQADQLITVPNAHKIPEKSIRAEYLFAAGVDKDIRTFFGYGIDRSFEIDLTSRTFEHGGTKASFDLSYSITDPFVNYVPGLTVGIVDALNNTPEGRRFYVATSYDIGQSGQHSGNTPMEVTIGAFGGSYSGPFVAITIPFSSSFKGLVEHDSQVIAAGVEIKPTSWSSVRWVFREQQVLWALGISAHF